MHYTNYIKHVILKSFGFKKLTKVLPTIAKRKNHIGRTERLFGHKCSKDNGRARR